MASSSSWCETSLVVVFALRKQSQPCARASGILNEFRLTGQHCSLDSKPGKHMDDRGGTIRAALHCIHEATASRALPPNSEVVVWRPLDDRDVDCSLGRIGFSSQARRSDDRMSTGPQAGGLHVLKVLIVEDDLMLADFAEEILVEHGYEITGIARTVADAVALARDARPDLVILDLRLADGGLGTEVAAQLPPLGRPGILYITGNMSQVALTCGDACLAKPYRAVDLLRGLFFFTDTAATGKAQSPFPPGFQLLHQEAAKSDAVLT